MTNIFIIVPGQILRTGLRTLLQKDPQNHIAGEAATTEMVGDLPPGLEIIVIDARGYEEAAFEELILELDREISILFLTEEHGEIPVLDEKRFRTWGIIPIDSDFETFNLAIKALESGLVVVDRGFLDAGASRYLMRSSQVQASSIEPLTARETEVLQLLARGLPNKQIAVALVISEHTVKFHISSIYGKLGVTNRTEATHAGVVNGIVTL